MNLNNFKLVRFSENLIIFFFFISLLIIGFLSIGDYGVSIDEIAYKRDALLQYEFIKNFTLDSGDIAILISGGHGLNVINDCEFIEVKQGPYNESTDKIRF